MIMSSFILFQLIILNAKAATRLVQILTNQKYHDYEKLLWTCSRLLKVLSACPNSKSEIVQVCVCVCTCMCVCARACVCEDVCVCVVEDKFS